MKFKLLFVPLGLLVSNLLLSVSADPHSGASSVSFNAVVPIITLAVLGFASTKLIKREPKELNE